VLLDPIEEPRVPRVPLEQDVLATCHATAGDVLACSLSDHDVLRPALRAGELVPLPRHLRLHDGRTPTLVKGIAPRDE